MKTILVVEDEKHLRTLYLQELLAEGYQVVTAQDGKEALETVKNSPIDLAILDIKLQGENGLEVLRDVMEQNRGLKVIINTAYSSYRNDFTSWSADAYIVKSSDLEELKSKVRELAPLVAGSSSSYDLKPATARPATSNESKRSDDPASAGQPETSN
jgi:DNA-binding response OmpR family regulator